MQMKLLISVLLMFSNFYCKSEKLNETVLERLLIETGSKDFLRYDFGISKLNSIIIVNSDTVFDVYILDANLNSVGKATVEKGTILDRLFGDPNQMLKGIDYLSIDSYNPLYYKLSYINNNTEFLLDSNCKKIVGNNQLYLYITSLKEFLIELWAKELFLNHDIKYVY